MPTSAPPPPHALACQQYFSPLASDKPPKQCIPENLNRCVRLEVLPGTLTHHQSLCGSDALHVHMSFPAGGWGNRHFGYVTGMGKPSHTAEYFCGGVTTFGLRSNGALSLCIRKSPAPMAPKKVMPEVRPDSKGGWDCHIMTVPPRGRRQRGGITKGVGVTRGGQGGTYHPHWARMLNNSRASGASSQPH